MMETTALGGSMKKVLLLGFGILGGVVFYIFCSMIADEKCKPTCTLGPSTPFEDYQKCLQECSDQYFIKGYIPRMKLIQEYLND